MPHLPALLIEADIGSATTDAAGGSDAAFEHPDSSQAAALSITGGGQLDPTVTPTCTSELRRPRAQNLRVDLGRGGSLRRPDVPGRPAHAGGTSGLPFRVVQDGTER
jgi:hypothetical protein